MTNKPEYALTPNAAEIIDIVPALIWSANPEGLINYLNQQWLEYTGATHDALLGNAWINFLHPADQERVTEKWKKCLTGIKPCEMDYRLRGRNEKYRWFKSSWTPILEKDGTIEKWCGVNTDIEDVKYTLAAYATTPENPRCVIANPAPTIMRDTDLFHIIPHISNLKQSIADTKYTLEAYANSEKRFRTIYNTAPVSIWEQDWTIILDRISALKQTGITNFPQYFYDHPEFVLEMFSAIRILDINEYTIEMFKAKTKADLNNFFTTNFTIKSLNYEVFKNALIAIAAERNIFNDELELRSLTDEILHVRAAFSFPSQYSNSGLVYACLVDITHQRLIEAKLKETLSFNEAILFNSPVAMAVYHQDGQCVMANDALWRLIGAINEPNLAQNFRSLDSQLTLLLDACLIALDTGESHHREIHIRLDSVQKDFWLDIQILPISLHDDPHLLLQFIDLSEMRQVTEELLIARNQAETANRAKSEFIANMSHELRTPLNVNMGLNQLLFETNLTHTQRDYLKKMYDSAKMLLGLINDILDFSKIEAGRLELYLTDFLLDEVINNCITLFSTVAEEKGLQLFFNVAPDIPRTLNGDSLRLTQILNNLLSNAIKFTERGEIEVSITRNDLSTPQLYFAVRDTGIGLDETQPIFNAFTQADTSITRKYGGTGLGLSICSKLVNLMGGEIGFKSIMGQGSTFYFTLPLCTVQQAIDIPPTIKLRNMRTLIVDDHETARRILENILKSWAMEVTVANSAEQAIQLLNSADQSGQSFELLLLDWKMPNMDGIELARYHRAGEIRKAGHSLSSVIMVSSAKREQVLENSFGLHIDSILEKPITASRLFDAIITLQNPNIILEKVSPLPPQHFWNGTLTIQGARILLAEDNYTNQLVARGLLEKMGLVIDIAENGRDALEMSQRGKYDAILMDLQMPEMDGFTAARMIRATEIGRALPIIAMTAAVMDQDRNDAFAAGMNDYLMKPINIQELTKVLLKWIKPLNHGIIPTISAHSEKEFILPGLNLTEAVKYVAGDWEMLRKVLLSFGHDFANVQEIFARPDAKQSLQEIVYLVHTIKGLSKNIGATELYNLAVQFEEELASGKQNLMLAFEIELQKVLDTIYRFEQSSNESSVSKISLEAPADISQAQILLEKLATILEGSFIPPGELLDQIREILTGRVNTKLLNNMFNRIEMFDFPTALRSLQELQEILALI